MAKDLAGGRAMKEFRRLGYRVGLAGTVIAGIAALTAFSTGAASSHVTDATRLIQFRGHAVKALPLFRVAAPSTMFWTNSGSFFQISSNGGYCDDGSVASNAHRGTTYIPPGRYGQLRVRAIGDWTITIRTGVEGVGTPIRFSGSGGKALPPFRLRSSKTMHWINTGTIFQTFPAGPKISGTVSSQDHSGTTHLPAGRYRLYINAVAPDEPMGSWTIIIR
jgi:hypothetical protein